MNEKTRTAIIKHGMDLLAMFPNATERDPIKLCKKLRRIETRANRAACDACNTNAGADAWESESERALKAVSRVLATDRVWINGDPRGYSLKVDLTPEEVKAGPLHKDWGGNGIIAPEIDE